MTEGIDGVDNSSILPVILPIALDNCQNSAVGAAVGAKLAIASEGFFRLTVEDFRENAIEIIKRVMFQGDRCSLEKSCIPALKTGKKPVSFVGVRNIISV